MVEHNVASRLVQSSEVDSVLRASASTRPTMICAAHPADTLNASTAALLQSTSGQPVVCVNPAGNDDASVAVSFADMVDDIEAARRHLGVERWVFWGMSGGGWLGQLYARRYPEALAGLILESACPCFRQRLADPDCVLSPLHSAWRTALAEQDLLSSSYPTELDDVDDGEWQEVVGVGSAFRLRGGPALLVSPMPLSDSMRKTMLQMLKFDARPWLADIRVPTLVMCGMNDPIVPQVHGRALAQQIPGAELLVLQDAGHVPVTQQDPAVATAVRDFIRRLRIARGGGP